jgi:hypothetical protein
MAPWRDHRLWWLQESVPAPGQPPGDSPQRAKEFMFTNRDHEFSTKEKSSLKVLASAL